MTDDSVDVDGPEVSYVGAAVAVGVVVVCTRRVWAIVVGVAVGVAVVFAVVGAVAVGVAVVVVVAVGFVVVVSVGVVVGDSTWS
jgi:hypothetical protein